MIEVTKVLQTYTESGLQQSNLFGNSELLTFNLPFIHSLILSFSEYQFHQIVHMEENNEKEYLQIKRYFVEVDVNKHGSAQLYRYSGWVVINKKNGTETICKPKGCLLYTSPSPRDATLSRMPSSA